jgi:hypothetical protein
MEGPIAQSIRNPKITHVCKTSVTTTRLHQTLLPLDRHVSLRCGSRTLTGGRNKPAHTKTDTTPHSLLLRHLHPYRAKLRHLRTRATSSHKEPDPLETALGSDSRPSHNPHRPCKSHLLEIPQKDQQESRTMVHGTTGLPPENKTCPREAARGSRPTVLTTRSRPGREQQLRRNPAPTPTLCKASKRTRFAVDLHRNPSGKGPTTTTGIHGRLAAMIPTRVHKISHGTPVTTMDERWEDGHTPRQPTKARSRTPCSQQTDRRTRRERLDPLHALEHCLVACHEGVGRRICQRMCPLSTEQKHQPKAANTPLQNHSPTTCPTIRSCVNGPDHSAAQESRVQRHSHDHRPQVHPSGIIHPMHHQCDRGRHHTIVPRQRVSMVRAALQDHL